ncbi:MAG: MFS transporter [Bacteroidetes bacterium]|nr:MFS transporter [Bacteroidota bacterium]
MSRQERFLLFLLALLNFTHILDFMIMMPLGNYLMPFFGITPRSFTYLMSAYTISAAVTGFLSAFYVDRFDRKKVLIIAYAGFILGTIACGIAPGFGWLLLARIVAGMFGGLIGAQVLSIIADTFSYERRGMAMGSIMSAFAVASTLGVPFSLYLANLISWHAPFLFVGVCGLAILPLLYRFIPSMSGHIVEADAEGNRKWLLLKNIMLNSTQRNALIFSSVVMMGHFMIIPFVNPYMEFNNGVSRLLTPMIYLVGGIASFFASHLLGRLADRYGKLKVYTIAVFSALPLIFAITSIHCIPFAWMLVIFAAWFVSSSGRAVTAQAMVSHVVKPEQRGSFQSFNSSMQQLGTGLASLIAGWMVVRGENGKILHYEQVGWLSIALLLMSIFIARQVFKNFDQSHHQSD